MYRELSGRLGDEGEKRRRSYPTLADTVGKELIIDAAASKVSVRR